MFARKNGARQWRLPQVWAWAVALIVCLTACKTAPYTKRSQLILIPEATEIALGADAYRQVLAKSPVSYDPEVVAPVRSVGERIAKAANQPMYKWEFNVIDKEEANAFALPGGKVAVYTGIFPLAQDTAGLAAILGHEVGHALARHAGERMSQGLLLDVVLSLGSAALGGSSPETRNLIYQALGLGAQIGYVLPFSRSQEAEADYIGLILMAKAGYDPEAALGLWQRFAEHDKERPPELLSTHPDPATRARNMRKWIPEAKRYFAATTPAPVEPLPTPKKR
ncbi:Beta-barrel assembly-enhancing protease [bacterium HR30]|nr:Beta-barrel assembly-enhancing protease [bacterium HR30]